MKPVARLPPAAADPLAEAVGQLAAALGLQDREAVARAGQQGASLWRQHLVAGAGQSPADELGEGWASDLATPVMVGPLAVHLVCPHHLTVALGQASLAYLPSGRLFGLGALARLAHACTARLVLQEEACRQMAEVLAGRARGAWAQIKARHPCLALHEPAAARAVVRTEAAAGDAAALASLVAMRGRRRRQR